MRFTSDNQPEGRGRKPKAEQYARPIAAAEKKIADKLPHLVGNLLKRADGGYEVIEEYWEPAGTVLIDGLVRDSDGALALDAKGVPVKGKVPAFPDLPADQLVLVRRKRTIADSDVGANEYLLDRIMGKSTQVHETHVDIEQRIRVMAAELGLDPDAAVAEAARILKETQQPSGKH